MIHVFGFLCCLIKLWSKFTVPSKVVLRTNTKEFILVLSWGLLIQFNAIGMSHVSIWCLEAQNWIDVTKSHQHEWTTVLLHTMNYYTTAGHALWSWSWSFSCRGFISDLYIGRRGLKTNKQALCLTLNIMTKQVRPYNSQSRQLWSSPIGGFPDQNRTVDCNMP